VSGWARSLVLVRGGHPERAVTVPNGFDPGQTASWRQRGCPGAKPRVRGAFSPGAPTLLTVIRLARRKGVDRVIAAMPGIVAAVPQARYVIAGTSREEARLGRLARESPARDAIVFLGAVTDDEEFTCLKRCDAFVMPSEAKGFGLVFLEAYAFDKPVIGARGGGAAEVVEHEETGLLVNPQDIDGIARAAVRLLRNAGEARSLGERGRCRAEERFLWKTAAVRVRGPVHAELEARR